MSFRGVAEASFVQRLFRRYYERDYINVFTPSQFEKREFGYMLFGQKVMVRHLMFRSFDELRRVLAKEAPLHVYRSAAVYQFPQAPMEEKGWLGAELIFDIDADHLETECKKQHDFLICGGCGAVLRSDAETCTSCGDKKVTEVNFVCEICLDATKKELIKLIDFLVEDFGFDKSSMTVSFSGNRGYHLSVAVEEVMDLDRLQRQELVEYITGTHLDLKYYGLPVKKEAGEGPSYNDPGWSGRIAKGCKKILERLAAGDEKVAERLSKHLSVRDVSELSDLHRYWNDLPRWDLLKSGRRSPITEVLVKMAVDEAAAHIDTVVTTDVHRLLRLADTLNGKTGLKACVVSLEKLDEFNPLRDAVVLDHEPYVEIKVLNAPAFQLGEKVYGPFKNDKIKLPADVAAYLLCRGVAELAKN